MQMMAHHMMQAYARPAIPAISSMLATARGMPYVCEDTPAPYSAMTVQDIRISARLTGEHALHFRELMRLECISVSDLVRKALRGYRAAPARPHANARELLMATGFEGPADLSMRHKDFLAGALGENSSWRVRRK
jgi:hypothetical protein